MIISVALEGVIAILKLLFVPIGATVNVPAVSDALAQIWPMFDTFLDMISGGFGLAAYFFYWDIIKVMIGCVLVVETALHTYKIVMWIYNHIPFIN